MLTELVAGVAAVEAVVVAAPGLGLGFVAVFCGRGFALCEETVVPAPPPDSS